MDAWHLVLNLSPYVLAFGIAVTLARLTTFTACAGMPPNWDDCVKEANAISANNRALKDKQARLDALIDELKQSKLAGPVGKFVSWINPLGKTIRPAEDIQTDIDRLTGEISQELRKLDEGKDLDGKIQKLYKAAKETEEKLKKAEHASAGDKKLELKSVVPGFPKEGTRLTGLGEFAARLGDALEKADPIVATKREQIATMLSWEKPLTAAMVDLSAGLTQVMKAGAGVEQTLRGFERMDAASRLLADRCFEFVLMDFDDGFMAIDALGEFLGTHPPVGALVARRDDIDGEVVHISGQIDLDAHLLTSLDTGDTIVVELPSGYHLTAPLKIKPSRSTKVTVTGNVAGSCAVAINVTQSAGRPSDSITVQIDQRLAVGAGACGTNELRIWNVDRAHGLAIPVTTIAR